MTSKIIGAAAILGLSAGIAMAVPAEVETDLNVRAGPGTGYPIIAVLPQGSTVEVLGCDGSWCRVVLNGREGFASRRYLDLAGTPPAVAVVPEPYYYDDYDEPYPYYVPGPVYGPSIGVYTGPAWRYRQFRSRSYVGRPRPGFANQPPVIRQPRTVGRPGFANQPPRVPRTMGLGPQPGFANRPPRVPRTMGLGPQPGFANQPRVAPQTGNAIRRGFADQPQNQPNPGSVGAPGFANQPRQ